MNPRVGPHGGVCSPCEWAMAQKKGTNGKKGVRLRDLDTQEKKDEIKTMSGDWPYWDDWAAGLRENLCGLG